MQTTARPRIGVAFNGDVRDRSLWSGTPLGIYNGLLAAGVDVQPINARLPEPLHRALGITLGAPLLPRARGARLSERARSSYSAGLIGPGGVAAQSAAVRARLRGTAPLDGIIQIGTGFSLPPVAPIVTYEDMTIPQALDYPYHHWKPLTARQVERRIDLQRRVYRVARSCCMTNSWAAASAREHYGVEPTRVHVVGVGSHEPIRRVERDWSSPRYLFIGVDWERKNGRRVVEAFRHVRADYPTATLDLVGIHPDVNEAGVNGHGRLHRDDPAGAAKLRELFDHATCFVMPSLFEPSAVVYTEAAASGLPSIGTNVGGSADLIGDAGVVVTPTDDGEIRAAMLDLARPERAAELGARALERAPLFTWQAVAERLLRGIEPGMLGRPLMDFLENGATPSKPPG